MITGLLFSVYDLKLTIEIYHGVCVQKRHNSKPPAPPPNVTMTFLVVNIDMRRSP